MSLGRWIRNQLGLSTTPANNFTLTAENADGTMKLHRGNPGAGTQDIMTVDANGLTVFPQGAQVMLLRAAKTATGTAVDFSPADGTGIPSWARKVTVQFSGVSTNGTSNGIIQLGSGSVQTTGYAGAAADGPTYSVSNFTTGCGIRLFAAANCVAEGAIVFSLHSGNTWVGQGVMARSDATVAGHSATRVALSGTLDRIRITTVTGTDNFDAGSVSLLIEG